MRWRSGRRWAPSLRFPEGSKMDLQNCNRRHAWVKLPKLGWVKFEASRGLGCEAIRSAALSREGIGLCRSPVEDGVSTPEQHAAPGAAVGVDRGVVVALAASDGELLDRPFFTGGEQRRAALLQRKLSRAGRRSGNRAKTRAALTKLRAWRAPTRLWRSKTSIRPTWPGGPRPLKTPPILAGTYPMVWPANRLEQSRPGKGVAPVRARV